MSPTACYTTIPLCQEVGLWEQSAYTHFNTFPRLLPEQAMHMDVNSHKDEQCYMVTLLQTPKLCQKLNTLLSSTVNQNVIFVHLQRVLELKGILWAILNCNHDNKSRE